MKGKLVKHKPCTIVHLSHLTPLSDYKILGHVLNKLLTFKTF